MISGGKQLIKWSQTDGDVQIYYSPSGDADWLLRSNWSLLDTVTTSFDPENPGTIFSTVIDVPEATTTDGMIKFVEVASGYEFPYSGNIFSIIEAVSSVSRQFSFSFSFSDI